MYVKKLRVSGLVPHALAFIEEVGYCQNNKHKKENDREYSATHKIREKELVAEIGPDIIGKYAGVVCRCDFLDHRIPAEGMNLVLVTMRIVYKNSSMSMIFGGR